MSDEAFVDDIWPTIEHANTYAESFAHFSKAAIIPLPADVDYPKTDEESIKRAQMSLVFAREIGTRYDSLNHTSNGTLQFETPQIEEWLIKTFKDALSIRLSNNNDDFFAAGVNSLQATQMRGLILKDIDFGGNTKNIGHNVIFNARNVSHLARHLYDSRIKTAVFEDEFNKTNEIKAMIAKHCHKAASSDLSPI